MGQTVSWRRGYGFLVAAAVGGAGLADWLFYGRPVGWTAGLFLLAVLVLLAVRGGGRFLRHRAGLILAAAAAGLVIAFIEEPTVLGVAFAALLVSLLAILNRAAWQGSVVVWLNRLIELATAGVLRMVSDSRLAARWRRRHGAAAGGSRAARAVFLWTLPVLLSAAFVGLFALANPIVSRLLSQAAEVFAAWSGRLPDLFNGLRMAFWVATALCVYALLRARVHTHRAATVASPAPHPYTVEGSADAAPDAAAVAWLGRGVVIRCLLAFNAVFAVQNALDVAYLFGGAALPAGMTYAEYAHRGSYPLVATALLAGLFVLITFRPGGHAQRSAAARRLVYLWLAQNVLLTFSAAWRLDLYVDAYSLTRLRLAAGLWMLLVAAGLVWIVCRIVLRRDNAWLLHVNLMTAGAVLYACCFLNTGGFIADYNVRHCAEAGTASAAPVDLKYLAELGPESLPALRQLEPQLTNPARAAEARASIKRLELELNATLSDWRGWTLRRGRVARE